MQPNTAASVKQPVRIFFVEDSVQVRERLEYTAALAGAHSVGHADGAEAAIRSILATHPDLVLLDMQLAQGSGLDVLRALRRDAPEIDVYVVSNYTEKPYRDCALRLGARGFFDKTHEFAQVEALIAARANPQLS
jgi:DNA-binding NarL/FixJ family response regulator